MASPTPSTNKKSKAIFFDIRKGGGAGGFLGGKRGRGGEEVCSNFEHELIRQSVFSSRLRRRLFGFDFVLYSSLIITILAWQRTGAGYCYELFQIPGLELLRGRGEGGGRGVFFAVKKSVCCYLTSTYSEENMLGVIVPVSVPLSPWSGILVNS